MYSILVAIALTPGCSLRQTVWSIPAAQGEPHHWSLELASVPIGRETVWRDDRHLRVERTWYFSVDGKPLTQTVERRALLAPDGHVEHAQHLDASGLQGWQPDTPAWLAEAPPTGPGPASLLDTRTGEVTLSPITETPRGRRVGERTWTHSGGWSIGALVARPVPAPLPLVAHDLLDLVRVPSPPLPRARQLHGLVLTLDGVQRSVEVPLRAELPRAEREAVDTLVSRVRGALEIAPVPGRASAADALAAGMGDCTEHVALFVETARDAGLQVRDVEGLVYVDDPKPGFVPHAWAEVRVGDAWVPVDPTWGQWPADAAHVPLPDEQRLSAITRAGAREIHIIDAR